MKKALIMTFVGAAVIVIAAFLLIPSGRGQTADDTGDSGQKETAEPEELVVYAYDSFASEWGPGPQVAELYEKKYGIPVRLESIGDAGQVLQKIILEKMDPQADVAVGIDNNLITRAREENVFQPYRSPGLSEIPEKLLIDDTLLVTPYDYGYFSIIYDTKKISNPPESLEELTDPRFKDSLILMDPRTSSPGLGFLMWTVYRYGEGFTDYWKRLMESTLTITEGWDSGYGLFTGGEAPMVLSYTTSPAYHVEYEETTRYQAAVFQDGHYMQIEGVGILRGAPHPEAAEHFIDFMISEEVQSLIPLTNWMYPVLKGVPLPESYDYAPEPEKAFTFSGDEVAANRDSWIDLWTRAVTH